MYGDRLDLAAVESIRPAILEKKGLVVEWPARFSLDGAK